MRSALRALTERAESCDERGEDSDSLAAVLSFDAEWKPENYYSGKRRSSRRKSSKQSLLERFKRRVKGVFLRGREGESDVVVSKSSKKKRKKGGSSSPVALLQLSTRERVWVVDLQLLCRAFPGGSSDTDLTQEEHLVNEALKMVFVDHRVLKIGLGPQTDLKRLSWSYPHMQCFKSFNAVIDVSTLVKRANPGVSARSIEGLSKLCQHVLKSAIDKSMQCSDWSARPLSQEQLNYASLDAFVLTQLFDTIVATLRENRARVSASGDDSDSHAEKGVPVTQKAEKKKTKRAPSAETVVRQLAVSYEVPNWEDLVKQELARRKEEEQAKLVSSENQAESSIIAVIPAAEGNATVGGRPLVSLRSVRMMQKPLKLQG
jgi:hypothetical protein